MNVPFLLKQLREQGILVTLSGANLELSFEKEDIPESLLTSIREHKQDIIDYLSSLGLGNATAHIPVAAPAATYPVTTAQWRFWILCQMDEINSAYNLPVILQLEGDLQVAALQQALAKLVARHEILRTHFMEGEDGMVVQRILEPAASVPDIRLIVLDDEEAVKEVVATFSNTPFLLRDNFLWRVCLIRQSATQHVLGLNIHHIIADGASLEIIVQELMQYYNAIVSGADAVLPALNIQFKDYAVWETSRNDRAGEEQYWLSRFEGELPILNLPAYQTRPALKTYAGAAFVHRYPAELVKKLKAFSREQKGTTFTTLMAALNALLYRYTGQTDIVLGTPVSGRNSPDLQGQVGLYINTLPVRLQFQATDSFRRVYELQKSVLDGAYAHAGYSFGELVNKLNIARDVSRSPLFDVLAAHQWNAAGSAVSSGFQGLKTSFYHDLAATLSKYDLTFTFSEDDEHLSAVIDYNTDLFQPEFVAQLAANFECFLREAITAPETEVQRIAYLDAAQIEKLVSGFNNTQHAYDTATTFVQLFEEQAAATPEAIALICEDQVLTYAALNEQSAALAAYLANAGIGPGECAGICMGRSADLLVAIIAVLRTGAAYLPIDPFYPLDRIDYVAAYSRTKFMLADKDTSAVIAAGFTVIDVSNRALWEDTAVVPLSYPDSASAAYVIFTSGSSGKPKGVQVSHRNLVNFMEGMALHFPRGQRPASWLAVTSISFDISILELLWTITRGDKVVLQLEMPVAVQPRPHLDFSLFYFPTGSQSEKDKYRLLLEGATFADQNGFKAIWVPERHFHNFGDQFPNPSVAAAAVSTITRNITIRSGSVVLPLHDEVRVAEEWSMIDNLSNGRVELSIASGWHPNDFVLAPAEYQNRHQSMRDKIATLTDFWEGKPLTRKNGVGKDFEFRLHPKPVQEKLQLWITAAGSPETFRYAGTIGANVLTHLLGQSIEDLAEKVRIYQEALKENGFNPAQGKVALMVHTFVDADAAAIRSTVEAPFKNYLRNSLGLLKPIAEENGLDVEQDMDTLLDMGFLRFYSTSGLFGTPEDCLDIINRIYASGVSEIACLIDFGIPDDQVLNSLQHLHRLKELVARKKAQADLVVRRMEKLTGDQETASLIKRYEVTHMQSTPSLYEELLLNPHSHEALQQINTLLVGGEELKRSLAEKLSTHTGRSIFNMYGPTETTIWSCVKELNATGAVTIGKPIANTNIYVLDHLQQLCPVGVAGELCIGGDGVAMGYLFNQELSDSRFLPDPFRPGERIYRTGDLGRWLPNGELECLGRLDRQVKLNGYRIELEEIESVLLSHPAVAQCVVTAVKVKDKLVLVAYFRGDAAADVNALTAFVKQQLPAFMVPAFMVKMQEFPHTANGKIDHKRLPMPDSSGVTARVAAPPRTPLQKQLVALWSDYLKTEDLGIEDNFFEIGGNSMKAFQLLSLMNNALQRELKIIVLFQYPTVRALSDYLEQHKAEKPQVQENELEDVDDLLDFMNNV
ncbi:LLM class flavin-dependent oxidoreductase [Chitinophaga oryzae]|uniref:LLM class flavin-dependent oxidoreductase n=1 Tax=Chitinophaga oryzae TaxID=2725414 RepID=A0ABX6LDE7_9BACT|nr:MupA/Atu3671 family FMN-dependent luciferase-like monooxygenase [Chitinophaga oryzae]QJB38145.1 LLM class flavin-dependent oxidoreductase [Chitinophaga oryzae]